MIELAEIFRRYAPAYRAQCGDRLLPRHRRAMWAIEHCRTEALGGHVYTCPECGETQYRYHSCRNRHCPKCQHEHAQRWLAQQGDLRLPVPYFMLTFTLPSQLRPVARSQQSLIYHLLFRASAEAAQQLAWDPRFVGGQIGLVGVLHTWARDLSYHPHVHYLVPAGGLADDDQTWRSIPPDFLVPVKTLSSLFRAKFRDALHKTDCFSSVPARVWESEWVVHCLPVGNGLTAFQYLAPYIFRVAISNRRLVKVEDDQVTFRYRASGTGETRFCTLPAEQFIHRFLQHVLPRHFVKVRYYGLFSPGYRPQLTALRQQLGAPSAPPPPAVPDVNADIVAVSGVEPIRCTATDTVHPVEVPALGSQLPPPDSDTDTSAASAAPPPLSVPTIAPDTPTCPVCGHRMQRQAMLPPHGRAPP